MRISKEALERATKARVQNPCPMCSRTSWSASSDSSAMLVGISHDAECALAEAGDDGSFRLRGRRVIPIICDNCGFIAMFDYEHLMDRVPD